MQSTDGDATDSAIDQVRVDRMPAYVVGFPTHVAITVRARPDAFLRRLLFADLLDLHECVGAVVADDRGQLRWRYRPKPRVEPEIGEFGDGLAAGEERRMLTDVSPVLGDLPEGNFRVAFAYVSPRTAYQAAPVDIRVRRPTAPEAAILASVASGRAQYPNWALWTQSQDEPVDTAEVRRENPLRLNLLLRQLFFGPTPPPQVDPSMLDVLDGVYAPEREALKAELLEARGDAAGYRAVRSRILRDTPGLAWWMRMIDKGGGYVKSLRDDFDNVP